MKKNLFHPPLLWADGEVHLWGLYLPDGNKRLAEFNSLLSEEEIRRAGRFHFQRDQNRFIVFRGALRILLGKYLKQDPHKIRIDQEAQGKPFVKNSFLQFNSSHSGDWGVWAFVKEKRVGIDIEAIEPRAEIREIARRFFAPAECAQIEALPQSEQARAFYACWTRKEALIKATGQGLSFPLNQFEVSVMPGDLKISLKFDPKIIGSHRWTLGEFSPAPSYAGAWVVEGETTQILYGELNDTLRGLSSRL